MKYQKVREPGSENAQKQKDEQGRITTKTRPWDKCGPRVPRPKTDITSPRDQSTAACLPLLKEVSPHPLKKWSPPIPTEEPSNRRENTPDRPSLCLGPVRGHRDRTCFRWALSPTETSMGKFPEHRLFFKNIFFVLSCDEAERKQVFGDHATVIPLCHNSAL